MDLWIRDQDRIGIFKVDAIFVNEKQIIKRVYGDNEVKGIVLGTYATKERALEVLDEIQSLLKGDILSHHINKFDIYNGENIKIYEMPKE